MSKVIFILGTSRPEGNTRKLIDLLNDSHKAPIVNLSTKSISYYDYEQRNSSDDFLGIIDQILESNVIVMATPVYWYSMSAQMKLFFDRTSDLLDKYKPRGKALRGRQMYLVTTGTGESLPDGFEVPFKKTSDYFNMEYRGCLYVRIVEDLVIDSVMRPMAQGFATRIFES